MFHQWHFFLINLGSDIDELEEAKLEDLDQA